MQGGSKLPKPNGPEVPAGLFDDDEPVTAVQEIPSARIGDETAPVADQQPTTIKPDERPTILPPPAVLAELVADTCGDTKYKAAREADLAVPKEVYRMETRRPDSPVPPAMDSDDGLEVEHRTTEIAAELLNVLRKGGEATAMAEVLPPSSGNNNPTVGPKSGKNNVVPTGLEGSNHAGSVVPDSAPEVMEDPALVACGQIMTAVAERFDGSTADMNRLTLGMAIFKDVDESNDQIKSAFFLLPLPAFDRKNGELEMGVYPYLMDATKPMATRYIKLIQEALNQLRLFPHIAPGSLDVEARPRLSELDRVNLVKAMVIYLAEMAQLPVERAMKDLLGRIDFLEAAKQLEKAQYLLKDQVRLKKQQRRPLASPYDMISLRSRMTNYFLSKSDALKPAITRSGALRLQQELLHSPAEDGL